VKSVRLFTLLFACSATVLWPASPAIPTACDSRPLNPGIAFTVSIPDAGPMIFDGTYLWVASSNLLTAINPATGAIVASQSIPGTQFMAYDVSSGTLWLEGGSQNAQLNKVNAQQIIANNGSASVDSVAFSSALPAGLALDSNASARNVWAVAGGVATIINMGSLEVVNTVSTPDGYPITQINQAYSLGGMVLSTSGIVGTQPVANVWLYGHNGEVIWESPYSQSMLSPGVWDGYANTQLSAEAGDGALYEYMFPPGGGTGNVALSTLQLTDAAVCAAAQAPTRFQVWRCPGRCSRRSVAALPGRVPPDRPAD
jgi:hypothetical protein